MLVMAALISLFGAPWKYGSATLYYKEIFSLFSLASLDLKVCIGNHGWYCDSKAVM